MGKRLGAIGNKKNKGSGLFGLFRLFRLSGLFRSSRYGIILVNESL